MSVRVDDLGDVARGFGTEVAEEITVLWRQAVRAYAPSDALVGETTSEVSS